MWYGKCGRTVADGSSRCAHVLCFDETSANAAIGAGDEDVYCSHGRAVMSAACFNVCARTSSAWRFRGLALVINRVVV